MKSYVSRHLNPHLNGSSYMKLDEEDYPNNPDGKPKALHFLPKA